MNAIDKGVYDKLKGNATLLASVNGIYNGQGTEGKSYPFITFFEVVDTTEDTFDATFEDCLYQIDIWTASDAEQEVTWTTANTILGYLQTAMDWTTLTVAGYNHVMCRRISSQRMVEDLDGRAIYRIMTEYQVMVYK